MSGHPSSSESSDAEIVTRRVLSATREQVFQVFSDPERLARWWGPEGFRNTFSEFDLRPGGEWRFVMHGPTGANYPNHSTFLEVAPPERAVFRHVSPPEFQMTVLFAEHPAGCELTWRMLFPSSRQCEQIRGLVAPAHEQNFDRLEAELARMQTHD